MPYGSGAYGSKPYGGRSLPPFRPSAGGRVSPASITGRAAPTSLAGLVNPSSESGEV